MKKFTIVILLAVLLLDLTACNMINTVEVIKCYYCGGKNSVDAKFCSSCGEAFEQKDELTSSEEQTTQEPPSSEETASAIESLPTEENVTVPEDTAVIPPENNAYVMRNSGADKIYVGSKVCVDGDILYLGYGGNLYVFCNNEVDSYSGGGSNSSTLAQIYLYNGFVYYTNLNNHCVYRMNLSDGKREIVLSGIGEIADSFMIGDKMYVKCVIDKKYNAIHSLNLKSGDSRVLFRESETVNEIDYKLLNERHVLIIEAYKNKTQYYVLDASAGVARELASAPWEGWAHYKNSEQYLYFRLYAYSNNTEIYYRVNKQDHSSDEINKDVYDSADDIPVFDGNEWQYYLSWGANNLCRMHKKTEVAEVLLKSGSGNRKEGELVAKTYAIKEIMYADDDHIIFKRSRMADGTEWSVWIIDSDGNNLSELIRDPYYDPHEVFPIGTSQGTPGGGNSGVSGSDNGTAVGTKTCALCEGDGKITCYYCKGTGKGPTVYVMGVPTAQGCSYCGSSGWRLCSGCGGKGVK